MLLNSKLWRFFTKLILNPNKSIFTYMSDNNEIFIEQNTVGKKRKYFFLINILLFIATFFTTTLAGVFWANQDPFQLYNFSAGLTYSVLLLAVISAHEFGHYFAARIHNIDVTLPFYIPFPFLFLNPFGTMGAVIKMKSRVQSRKSLFDIGVAGPISGWVVAMTFLIIGYLTLPPISFLYSLHPEYQSTGIPTTGLTFGYNIVFWVFEKIFAGPKVFIPPMNEIYHYPFLCVGWFGLLITALNMMPVGQLDGGHISYTMFGDKHKIIAYIIFALLVIFGLAGLIPLLGVNLNIGSVNWLVWAILVFFIIKIKHPPIVGDFNEPLGTFRTILGWISFVIFVISFCPVPITDF
jgi:membrane-associated protease RseP (regulator of RpoE activity)